MTSLTVNGSAAAATTLVTAGKLFNTTGGTSGSTSTKVGSGTLFKQIFALGTSTSQTGVASIPAPTDSNFSGWMWDVTTLEGQRIAAGTWTPTLHLLASTGTTVTPTVQWFKRSSAGAYTSIGSVTGSSIALTTSAQLLVFTAPSLALMDFVTGDKLCCWLWVNQTAGGATNSTISVVEAISGSSAGVISEAQAVTPGYASSVVTTTFPFTELLVASDMQPALFRWPVDALTAADNLLQTDVALPVEAASISDKLLATDTDLPIEAASVSDIQSALFRWPADALVATDSLLVQESGLLVDSLAASDAFLETDTELAIDTLVATDSLLNVDVAVLLEALTGVDVELAVDLYGTIDTLSANDSASTMTSNPAGGVTTTTFSFLEALIVTDSFLSVDGALLIEANSATDSMGGSQASLYTENLTTSDSLLKLDGYIPFDVLTAGDMGSVQRWPVNNLVASDTLVVSDWYQARDVQSVLESLLTTDGARWIELLTAGDTEIMISTPSAQPPTPNALIYARSGRAGAQVRAGQANAGVRGGLAGCAVRAGVAGVLVRSGIAHIEVEP
jgi:hypothetical protein